MNYQYSYLIGDLALLVVWLFLFIKRKDLRKSMIFVSLMFALLGIAAEGIYIQDWWHPLTITNTGVGIEDFIFGWVVGGIAAVVYEEFANRKIRKEKRIEKIFKSNFYNAIFPLILLFVLFFGSFLLLKLNSFYSSVVAFTISIAYIWIQRRDLIPSSIFSGLLLFLISLIGYIVPELMSPGWIRYNWFMQNLSGITILTIPIEDLIWFFLTGAFIGPLWEYWQQQKLVNIKRKNSKKSHKSI